jgi:hypothetical protein
MNPYVTACSGTLLVKVLALDSRMRIVKTRMWIRHCDITCIMKKGITVTMQGVYLLIQPKALNSTPTAL